MENLGEYRRLTQVADWAGICALNGLSLDSFGTGKELGRLKEHLEADEVVIALASGSLAHSAVSNAGDRGFNTWLLALTNERFLFLDCALLSSSVDVQSIRLNQVQAVSCSQGWVLGKVMVDLGSRMVTIDNCPKAAVKVISDKANKLLRAREAAPTFAAAATGSDDMLAKLERLTSLHAAGSLTDDEFAQAKARVIQAS